MDVEVIIYIYMAVCISMILFNLVTILSGRMKKKNLVKRHKWMLEEMEKQLRRLRDGQETEAAHLKWLAQKLKRIGNLEAFENAVGQLKEQEEALTEKYVRSLYPVFQGLAMEYAGREDMEAAYFAYLIRRYKIVRREESELLQKAMLKLLKKKSVYCRENALHVIYMMGDADLTVTALFLIDRHDMFHHAKLIHDGLLEFAGDKGILLEKIWEAFDRFSTYMQVTLINYMRLSSRDCCEKVFAIMTRPDQEDEVCFACMRYFGKHYYEPAYPVLIGHINGRKKERWEYAAIAASVLLNYRSEHTIELLKEALYSSNWYVRNNAAESLEGMGVAYSDLAEVFEGNDRYAREILQYWMDYRSAKEKEAASV